VVIFGSGFTGTTSVQFNGTTAPFSVVSALAIIASIPAGATTGPITVQNAADTATTAPHTFTITH
jgi:large repetitive protein